MSEKFRSTEVLVPREERLSARRFVRLQCVVVRDRDFRQIGDVAIDLSPEGMLVLTKAELQKGEQLFISFRTTPFDIWFDCEATVTRLVRGYRRNDHGRALGVRFRTFESLQGRVLKTHLRHLPPVVPTREKRIDYAATTMRIASGM
jgi:hypothetical protein